MIILLGPYNLVTASCQTFSDEFLKQLGSGGYMTHVKMATAAAVAAGVVGVAVGIVAATAALFSWSSKGDQDAYDEEDDEYEEDDE